MRTNDSPDFATYVSQTHLRSISPFQSSPRTNPKQNPPVQPNVSYSRTSGNKISAFEPASGQVSKVASKCQDDNAESKCQFMTFKSQIGFGASKKKDIKINGPKAEEANHRNQKKQSYFNQNLVKTPRNSYAHNFHSKHDVRKIEKDYNQKNIQHAKNNNNQTNKTNIYEVKNQGNVNLKGKYYFGFLSPRMSFEQREVVKKEPVSNLQVKEEGLLKFLLKKNNQIEQNFHQTNNEKRNSNSNKQQCSALLPFRQTKKNQQPQSIFNEEKMINAIKQSQLLKQYSEKLIAKNEPLDNNFYNTAAINNHKFNNITHTTNAKQRNVKSANSSINKKNNQNKEQNQPIQIIQNNRIAPNNLDPHISSNNKNTQNISIFDSRHNIKQIQTNEIIHQSIQLPKTNDNISKVINVNPPINYSYMKKSIYPNLTNPKTPFPQENTNSLTISYAHYQNLTSSISTQYSKSSSIKLNHDSPAPTLSLSDFQLLPDRLGKGAYADVFLARELNINFLCVLKRISKKKLPSSQFLTREIKTQLYLQHPNLTAMYGFFADDTYIYLVLEYLHGGALQQHRDHRKMPQEEVADIILQTVQGVKYMHQHEIMHRDIKPQNLLLHEGVVKVSDFGCAVVLNKGLRRTFIGCLEYSAPEQLNSSEHNQMIDIWSIGVLTYELLTARSPFTKEIIHIVHQNQIEKHSKEYVQAQKSEAIHKHSNAINNLSFPQNLHLKPQTEDFIRKILKYNPKDRADLRTILEHEFLREAKNCSIAHKKRKERNTMMFQKKQENAMFESKNDGMKKNQQQGLRLSAPVSVKQNVGQAEYAGSYGRLSGGLMHQRK